MVKRDKAWWAEQDKQSRLMHSIEDNTTRIKDVFSFPVGVTPLDLNKAIIMGDQVEIDRLKGLLDKCKIKCDRICKLLAEALNAEARDAIMCKITMDLDAEF